MRGFALLVAAVLVSIVTSVATVLSMERLKLIAAPQPTHEQPAAKVGVPSLKGLSENDARENLKALGLVFLVSERKTVSGAGPGTVVEQSPAAGQQLDPHVPKGSIVSQLPAADAPQETDKPVIVRVSAGPGEIEVPKLLGQGLEKTRAQAKELGLELKILWTEMGETPTFVVLSQNPAAGKKIKPGEAVTVTINR